MTNQLSAAISRLPNNAVLVIGDVMLDRFVYGQVERISPEAPIPVMQVQRESITLGGAGNVVRNVVALNGHVVFVGVIGDDKNGQDLEKILGESPTVNAHLVVDSLRPTTLKTRYVANGQQLLRADHELAQPLSQPLETQVIARMTELIGSARVVVLSDYAKGVLTPNIVKHIIDQAKIANCKVLVDPKGRDFGRYHGATILTPNRKELSEAYGSAIRTVEDAEKAARLLIEKNDLSGILAKLGSDGVCLVMRDQPAQHFQTLAREVYDVSGAGDTVMATLALGLAGGLPPEQAAELANLAGSVVVGKVGTATVTTNDLERALREDRAQPTTQKFQTFSEIEELAERWRKQGHKIGFTNGVFDLLYPGHISLLEQARTKCDKLVVGLNSDGSIRRIKGEGHPVQNEVARSTVLASLTCVDALVVFDGDTPVSLIETIHPDVLVKGSNYSLDQIVGANLVKSWGGQVILVDIEDGQNTPSIIAELRARS